MTPHFIAGLVLTGLVGASLGVLGAGGSIIMLPVLVYVIGVEPHTAVPLSLAIVGATSLLSAAARSGDGEIQWRAALLFGSAALIGAALGTRLTYLVQGSILLLSFGLLLVVVGVRMWRGSSARETHTIRPARPALMLSAGGVIGTLTGFLGVGGGFLIVPSLMAVGGLGIRMAVSTSLVVIAMSSAAGLVAHLAHGAPVSAPLALSLILAAALGMMAGMRGARRVSSRQLQRAFALFVMAVGAVLILINTPAALRLLASSGATLLPEPAPIDPRPSACARRARDWRDADLGSPGHGRGLRIRRPGAQWRPRLQDAGAAVHPEAGGDDRVVFLRKRRRHLCPEPV